MGGPARHRPRVDVSEHVGGGVGPDSVGPRRGNLAALAFTLKHAEALSDRLLKRRIRRM